MEKKCCRCNRKKSLDEFTKRRSGKDGYNAACKACTRQATKDHYRKNKEYYKAKAPASKIKARAFVIQLKEVVPCLDCKIKYPYYVMDYDHVRGVKDFEISTSVKRGWSLDRIRDEVSKCDLVCSNCHRARTYNRMISKRS